MKFSSSSLSVIVQGPVVGASRERSSTAECLHSIRRFYPKAEIIFSTWPNQSLEGLSYDVLVVSPDPGVLIDYDGALNNINRQIVSTHAGLDRASRDWVVKFRSDFEFLDDSFCSTETEPTGFMFERRIRILELFVRDPVKVPLLFHVSDLVQFGRTKDIRAYWNQKPVLEKDLFVRRKPRFWFANFAAQTRAYAHVEQVLAIRFLRTRGCNIQIDHPDQLKRAWFDLSESFLSQSFEIVPVGESGVRLPSRMFRSFVKTVMTPVKGRYVTRGGGIRYAAVLGNKYCLFVFRPYYWFVVYRYLKARYPHFENVLIRVRNALFKVLRAFKSIDPVYKADD